MYTPVITDGSKKFGNNRWNGFNLLDCNVRSINFIVNRLTSNLLIERYIKWLEVIQQPEKFKYIYPDDRIPAYLMQIPLNLSEEISFYFPTHRFQYMQTIINDIKERRSCPINKSTQHSPYKSPQQTTLERMDNSSSRLKGDR